MWLHTGAFIVTLALSLFVASRASDAQQTAQVPRIGYLQGTGSGAGILSAAFRQGLRELGYVEGQNLLIEFRNTEGQVERLPALAAELVRLPVDVIVTEGENAARVVQQATRTIPIVLASSGDPVELGLVASLARPGGNITGLSLMSPDVVGKRLELLKEAAPRVARVAVLYHPPAAATVVVLREVQAAAPALGLTVLPMEVRTPDEFDDQFASMLRLGADALLTAAGPFASAHHRRILDWAAIHQLPTACGERSSTEAGCLLSYSTSLTAAYRRAATYVDKILKGAKPADLPVEQPTTFELVLNLKTAKALGLTFPPHLLVLADKVIQ